MTTECATERLEFGACEGSESSVDLTVGSSAQMAADCCCGSWGGGPGRAQGKLAGTAARQSCRAPLELAGSTVSIERVARPNQPQHPRCWRLSLEWLGCRARRVFAVQLSQVPRLIEIPACGLHAGHERTCRRWNATLVSLHFLPQGRANPCSAWP